MSGDLAHRGRVGSRNEAPMGLSEAREEFLARLAETIVSEDAPERAGWLRAAARAYMKAREAAR